MALFLGASSAHAPHSVSLFATGMNGDEDLSEDITMKGDKFHYMQVGAPTNQEALQLFANPPEKVLEMDPKYGRTYTSFYAQQKSKGINNGEVRPDVWFEVSKMIDPVT